MRAPLYHPPYAIQLVVVHRQHPTSRHPPPVLAHIIVATPPTLTSKSAGQMTPTHSMTRQISQVPAYRKLLDNGPTRSLVLTLTMVESNLIPFLGLYILPLNRPSGAHVHQSPRSSTSKVTPATAVCSRAPVAAASHQRWVVGLSERDSEWTTCDGFDSLFHH